MGWLDGVPQRGVYLEGQEDFVSRLISPIASPPTLVIPIIYALTKSPGPPQVEIQVRNLNSESM